MVLELSNEKRPSSVLSVLRASCGTALAYNGLTTVNWFIRAALALDIKQVVLLEYIITNHTENFVEGIVSLLTETAAGKLKTFPYARLFDGAYDTKWAVNYNKKVTALLVALTEGSSMEEHDVWNYPHLHPVGESDRNWGIDYAAAIRAELCGVGSETGLAEKSRKIVARINAEALEAPRSAAPVMHF